MQHDLSYFTHISQEDSTPEQTTYKTLNAFLKKPIQMHQQSTSCTTPTSTREIAKLIKAQCYQCVTQRYLMPSETQNSTT